MGKNVTKETSKTGSGRTFHLTPATALNGTVQVPGDKSMSHRSIMFGAIAQGVTEVSGFLEGEDSLHTLDAFRAMGVRIERGATGEVTLYGQGIVNPLTQMGANIETGNGGTPPLTIKAGATLNGIDFTCPMASAQVKSAVLLAGLHVDVSGLTATIQGGQSLTATSLTVPGDISSSAFFLVGASMTKGSELTLTNVGMNPTRTGVIDILKLMGANITVQNERVTGGEPVVDLHVLGSQLSGIEVPEELVSLAIDEFPALFVAAAAAKGTTVVTGAEELRVKETDRIQVMADGLRALGAHIEDKPDGAIIQGGRLSGGQADSCGDHRTAMSFAMASLISDGPITVLDCDNVNTSFPGFADVASRSGLNIEEQSV